MDPDVVLESLRQAIADWESYGHCDIDNAIAAVADLDEWLTKGGFLPKDWRR